MTIITKIKAPETRDLWVNRRKLVFFFLKYLPLHQDNFLAQLFCLVTYVTSLISALVLKSNLKVYDSFY